MKVFSFGDTTMFLVEIDSPSGGYPSRWLFAPDRQ
jgi:hypothetical protein